MITSSILYIVCNVSSHAFSLRFSQIYVHVHAMRMGLYQKPVIYRRMHGKVMQGNVYCE